MVFKIHRPLTTHVRVLKQIVRVVTHKLPNQYANALAFFFVVPEWRRIHNGIAFYLETVGFLSQQQKNFIILNFYGSSFPLFKSSQ